VVPTDTENDWIGVSSLFLFLSLSPTLCLRCGTNDEYETGEEKTPSLLHHTSGASVCGGYREPLLLSVNELKQTHPSDTQIESDGRVGVEEKVFPSIVFFRFFSSYLLFLILFFVLFFPLTGAVCGTKQVRS
jgi:hypothetical protein